MRTVADPLTEEALEALRTLTGDPRAEFRDGQLEAIRDVVVDHARVLCVQRTGWGKSAVYFVATTLLRRAVRAPDPYFGVRGPWIVRRLAPDCTRIELVTLAKERDELKLLRAMLRAGVMEDQAVVRTGAGTPQGGVISPCLCNVYLHRLDRQWTERGHGVLVRYADDGVPRTLKEESM